MPDRKPIWTASRLNEIVRRYRFGSVGFTPIGGIFGLGMLHSSSSGQLQYRVVRQNETTCRTNAIADLYRDTVVGLETVTTNLVRLPLLLAICALDPESWCAVVVHSEEFEAAGPFREVTSPLHEWLFRAALAGRSIRMHHAEWAGLPIEPVDEVTLISIDPNPESKITDDRSSATDSAIPELVPTNSSERADWLVECLELSVGRRFGCAVKSETDAIALAAGVWQMNGFLDRSHELAQSVEGKGRNGAGDYWHAIMHRREPDYSNAKYWFRRVGHHNIHTFLARDADDILAACGSADAPRWRKKLTEAGKDKWNALSFVDLCESVANGHDAELSQAARQIQLIEMALLLSSTYHDAAA